MGLAMFVRPSVRLVTKVNTVAMVGDVNMELL
jgi:hypothetical protein